MEKTCILCKHIYMHPSCRGYSEYTPGYDATIGCQLGKWYVSLHRDTTETYRAKLLSAKDCDQFELYAE
jgi:hypothetical protein